MTREAQVAGYDERDTWDEAWEKYEAAHPEVLSSWRKVNGRWPMDHPNAVLAELADQD